MPGRLLGVRDRDDVGDGIPVVCDGEVKPPIAVHTCLPDISGFIKFLGVQGRMLEVVSKKRSCLSKAR